MFSKEELTTIFPFSVHKMLGAITILVVLVSLITLNKSYDFLWLAAICALRVWWYLFLFGMYRFGTVKAKV